MKTAFLGGGNKERKPANPGSPRIAKRPLKRRWMWWSVAVQ